MNPERLANNAAMRFLVNHTSLPLARAVLTQILARLALSPQKRGRMTKRAGQLLSEYLPELDDQQRQKCLRSLNLHWSKKLAEDVITLNLKGPARFERLFADYYVFENAERLAQAVALGRGVLLVGSHVGSISLGTTALYSLLLTIPSSSRPSIHTCTEPDLERFPTVAPSLEKAMAMYGVDASFILTSSGRSSVARQMCMHLSSGNIVTTNLDVLGGGASRQAFSFLDGRPIFLPAAVGAAKVALSTGATVVPWLNYRTDKGYVLRLESPLGPFSRHEEPLEDDHPEVKKLSSMLAEILSNWVRSYPDQWVYWDRLHRRIAPEQARS
jgi:lauroyl/myristoyl acyltransferase